MPSCSIMFWWSAAVAAAFGIRRRARGRLRASRRLSGGWRRGCGRRRLAGCVRGWRSCLAAPPSAAHTHPCRGPSTAPPFPPRSTRSGTSPLRPCVLLPFRLCRSGAVAPGAAGNSSAAWRCRGGFGGNRISKTEQRSQRRKRRRTIVSFPLSPVGFRCSVFEIRCVLRQLDDLPTGAASSLHTESQCPPARFPSADASNLARYSPA